MQLTRVEIETLGAEVRLIIWVWRKDEFTEQECPYAFTWSGEQVTFMAGGWSGNQVRIAQAKTQREAQSLAEEWLEAWLKDK